MKVERTIELETNDIHAGDIIHVDDFRMKVKRTIEVETNDIHVGDKIHVGKYTATCQKITPKSALFLLNQYITERGDPQEAVQNEDILNIFTDIRDQMIPFYNGELLQVPFGYGYVYQDATTFRPVFLISMRKEDTTKKSAPENEETIQDVLNTFNEKQRLVNRQYIIAGRGSAKSMLNYIASKKIENEETIQDVFNTFNEKQRLVLNYIVGKAIENEETILDVLVTLNDKQRLVLNYLVNKAVKDAKKGKTSESDEEDK